MKFSIDDDRALLCDVDTLVDTRALVQANSGGGKSWLLRRILEQTHGKVQHLVLDPEGEFASLREKYDYVHAAARGGDTIAHPRSAALLAERLLELKVSAVLDLYELKAHERVRFVRLFLEALMELPKKLWHPVLVVVDEAHVFAPQTSSAESAGAVIDLCSRGRKRGFSALLATQRIAKLHKDAAAELNNKLIGRTGLDLDLSRAADELGFAKSRWPELKEAQPGQFFAFGPAFDRRGVVQVRVGSVTTTHPKAGARIAFKGAPPTDKIRALLPKLGDLPAEAEERAKSLDELRQEITKLKRELAAKPRPEVVKAKPAPVAPMLRKTLLPLVTRLGKVQNTIDDIYKAFHRSLSEIEYRDRRDNESTAPVAKIAPPAAPRPPPRERPASTGSPLPEGERIVLTAIAQHDDGVDRAQITVLTGYKRSTRDAYVSRLSGRDLIAVRGTQIVVTPDGLDALGPDFARLPEGDELRDYWRKRLPDGESRIFDMIVEAHPDSVSRDLLTERSGYKRSTRDAYISRLAARRLVFAERGGHVRASDRLF